MKASPQQATSRQLALHVLLEWERGQTFATDIIDRVAVRHSLERRDTALLQSLVLGVLRNISLLDHWLDQACENKHLEDRIHWLLRLGAAQLLILEIAPHAAVNETVNLADKARGLVNAVLRRLEREKESLLAQAPTLPFYERFTHPDWLVQRWIAQRGQETAVKWCASNQEQAPTYIRINRLHPNPLDPSSIDGLNPTAHPDFYLVEQLPRELIESGLCYVQDPSTVMACNLLAPQPGESVFDACAAPGGKTAYLAQLMRNEGTITACDNAARRLDRLTQNLRRMFITNSRVVEFDVTSQRIPPWGAARFDRILLDVPCSNTGVMRRRVDVRWRLEGWSFRELAHQQRKILSSALPLLKPGGTLVYSTCSLDNEENEQVIESALKCVDGFSLEETRELTLWHDGTDGAFAGRIVRAP
jgi:16S rRNA (cytosine967-C5)-methyltransferase